MDFDDPTRLKRSIERVVAGGDDDSGDDPVTLATFLDAWRGWLQDGYTIALPDGWRTRITVLGEAGLTAREMQEAIRVAMSADHLRSSMNRFSYFVAVAFNTLTPRLYPHGDEGIPETLYDLEAAQQAAERRSSGTGSRWKATTEEESAWQQRDRLAWKNLRETASATGARYVWRPPDDLHPGSRVHLLEHLCSAGAHLSAVHAVVVTDLPEEAKACINCFPGEASRS